MAVRLRGRVGEPDTEVVRYGYDGSGLLTEVVNSSGRPLRFAYDPAGRMIGWVDRNGTEYTYDAAGRVVRTVGSAGCLDGSIVYDTDRHVTVETNSLGHAIEYQFTEAMQLRRQVDSLGGVTVYEWDRYDRKLAETDPLGRAVRYRYDGNGNLTAVVNPVGARTGFAYDDRGRLTTVTDAVGQVRRVVTDAAGRTVRFAHDEAGREIERSLDSGVVLGQVWDVNHQLLSQTVTVRSVTAGG